MYATTPLPLPNKLWESSNGNADAALPQLIFGGFSMRQSLSLFPLVLAIFVVVSGCQSNDTTDIHNSVTSVLTTEASRASIQPEVALSDSEDSLFPQSTLDELAKATGDTPPQYDRGVVFSLENGILMANGEPVPHNVTILDLSNSDFPDYQFLEDFSDLEELNLSSSGITDTSVLSGLTKLQRLSLSSSGILDISPIKCLPKLWLLDVSCTAIDFDFQGWTCKDTLEVLYISSTETSTLTGISSLSQLLELRCCNIPATDFSDLSALENMENLNLSQTTLEDLAVLSGMAKLRILDISTTNVQDFSTITAENFPKLTTLSVSVPEFQASEIEATYPSLNVQNFYDGE